MLTSNNALMLTVLTSLSKKTVTDVPRGDTHNTVLGACAGGGARKGRGRGGEGEMLREWNGKEMRHGKWMKE